MWKSPKKNHLRKNDLMVDGDIHFVIHLWKSYFQNRISPPILQIDVAYQPTNLRLWERDFENLIVCPRSTETNPYKRPKLSSQKCWRLALKRWSIEGLKIYFETWKRPKIYHYKNNVWLVDGDVETVNNNSILLK